MEEGKESTSSATSHTRIKYRNLLFFRCRNIFGRRSPSENLLRKYFSYVNFFKYVCAYTRAKCAQRRTSIFPLLLPEQDQPRMSILLYFKPPLPLYERESLLTHTHPRLSRASLEIFSNWKYFRTTQRVRK